jgi:hypothetical protein
MMIIIQNSIKLGHTSLTAFTKLMWKCLLPRVPSHLEDTNNPPPLDIEAQSCAPPNHPNISYTDTHPNQTFVKPLLDGEGLLCVPDDSSVLLGASQGSGYVSGRLTHDSQVPMEDGRMWSPDIRSPRSEALGDPIARGCSPLSQVSSSHST